MAIGIEQCFLYRSVSCFFVMDGCIYWNMGLDCAKHDPVVNEDTEKHFAELLTEELKLREVEGLEIQ
ncbi:hypothetical protein PVK06_043043 [Gossypium arboreum]|uniref:Uncharacterized protein n=1 Tax=Gossypium arboreum TaxID=29729 RepID=A0ABR0MPY3_GOSAR|nr:hypothetical protein PVK06_043043 [Gossypium arboreum]